MLPSPGGAAPEVAKCRGSAARCPRRPPARLRAIVHEELAVPLTITHGYSKDKRPELKQFVFSTLCVDRAVPLWGTPADGNASDQTLNNTLLSDIATFLAQPGVAPCAYIYVADAALVTEDPLAALGDPLCISRLPATYNACGRLITEAGAHNTWAEVGGLASTKPTKH